MIRLLIDQGLPRSAAVLLREAGVDAVHTGESGLATATDEGILRTARDEQRVVVTLDADFHALLALSAAASPSVIRFRIEGLNGTALARLLCSVLKRCENDLEEGALVTVLPGRIRIRHLPILR